MEEMFFSGTPLLEAVGLEEPFVFNLRDTVRHAISKSLIPMKAYAQQYENFLSILNLDIPAYIKSVSTQFRDFVFLSSPKVKVANDRN